MERFKLKLVVSNKRDLAQITAEEGLRLARKGLPPRYIGFDSINCGPRSDIPELWGPKYDSAVARKVAAKISEPNGIVNVPANADSFYVIGHSTVGIGPKRTVIAQIQYYRLA